MTITRYCRRARRCIRCGIAALAVLVAAERIAGAGGGAIQAPMW